MIRENQLSPSLPAWKDAALLLLGHGSSTNTESSQPTRRHAETIRSQGLFSEVVTAFWKEEPYFSDILKEIQSEHVYVVPNFISEGYYTKGIIPREFRMTGRLSQTENKTLYYCNPVGGHAAMTEALLSQAREVLAGSSVAPAEVDLILVGHGTLKNKKSTEAIQRQVKRIAEQHLFRQCTDAYMEEAPLISEWDQLTDSGQVVVVPFFIADGLHSYEDIPELMGLMNAEGASGFPCPASLRGKTLWYARSIGNQAEMVSVILDMVRDFKPDSPFCSSCPQ
ncbi:MAG: CbiX/SirB N-terminal domain-containing protein [Verrucomicrobiota bacterium]